MATDPIDAQNPVQNIAPDAEYETGLRAQPHLTYRGGKVLTNPSLVSLYYGSYWETAHGKAEAKYENNFAKYLSSSPYMDLWSQYGAGKAKFAGTKTIATASSPKTVTDADIRRIVSAQIASGNARQPDGETIYTVFLPPKTVLKAPGNISSRQGLGGYHGSFDSNGKRVYYAAIVYSKGANGIDFDGLPRDNISITASHEWSETVTDPDANNGKLGWYDNRLGEIADIPINQGLPLTQVFGRLGKYAVQKLWSNEDGRNEVAKKGAYL